MIPQTLPMSSGLSSQTPAICLCPPFRAVLLTHDLVALAGFCAEVFQELPMEFAQEVGFADAHNVGEAG